MTDALLDIRSVTFRYPSRQRSPGSAVLDGVTLSVERGECVGVIGESGSGKSTLAGLAVGLLEPVAGEIRLFGQAVTGQRPQAFRRRLQFVFQDPYGSLDPSFTVEQIVAEGLEIHQLGARESRRAVVAASLADVGLGAEFLLRRPHELSGGQRQRVAIARALAVEPELIILDEPTSALDLMVQAQILNLLLNLQARRELAFLLISHDLDVVRHIAHRVYVIETGRIVESGDTDIVLRTPAHPYTRRLLAAAPRIGATP